MKCDKCLCRPVCDRYKATGGHVNGCGHRLVKKTGHWIRRGNEKKCSCCGFIYYSNHDDWNGCPNCLADMRGEEDGK